MKSWQFILLGAVLSLGADAPSKPSPARMIPGKIVIPTDNMRRIWGELVSLDLKTRTGKFRNEGTNEVQSFVVMPYAELLHHATLGDLQDFRVGERAIFRVHPDDAGQWTLLTYIQDEMNFLNNHKEYYWVDRIDSSAKTFECTDANADQSYVREKGIVLETESATRYWKQGSPASFADIKVGDRLRTKTHGIGEGKHRVCWEVFLDDESLLMFQAEQQAVHRARIEKEGLPAYVDVRNGNEIRLTLFPEARDWTAEVKPGRTIRVAAAGVDRRPTTEPASAKVKETGRDGRFQTATLTFDAPPGETIAATRLVRVWIH